MSFHATVGECIGFVKSGPPGLAMPRRPPLVAAKLMLVSVSTQRARAHDFMGNFQ